MTIEHKTGLFYELLIRGNWDPQNGPLGQIMTYQLQTGSCLVNTETNKLAAAYTPDPAIDLTKDQAVKFLGAKFAGFLDQLTSLRQEKDALQAASEAAAGEAKSAIEARDARIAEVVAERDGLIRQVNELAAAKEEVAAGLAVAEQKLAIRAEIAAMAGAPEGSERRDVEVKAKGLHGEPFGAMVERNRF